MVVDSLVFRVVSLISDSGRQIVRGIGSECRVGTFTGVLVKVTILTLKATDWDPQKGAKVKLLLREYIGWPESTPIPKDTTASAKLVPPKHCWLRIRRTLLLDFDFGGLRSGFEFDLEPGPGLAARASKLRECFVSCCI